MFDIGYNIFHLLNKEQNNNKTNDYDFFHWPFFSIQFFQKLKTESVITHHNIGMNNYIIQIM